jgi:hypothetical protein
VLVAASRTDHPHHALARDWLEDALGASSTGAAFTLMPRPAEPEPNKQYDCRRSETTGVGHGDDGTG